MQRVLFLATNYLAWTTVMEWWLIWLALYYDSARFGWSIRFLCRYLFLCQKLLRLCQPYSYHLTFHKEGLHLHIHGNQRRSVRCNISVFVWLQWACKIMEQGRNNIIQGEYKKMMQPLYLRQYLHSLPFFTSCYQCSTYWWKMLWEMRGIYPAEMIYLLLSRFYEIVHRWAM